MAEGSEEKPKRVVFSREAEDDLAEIHRSTHERHGSSQADAYIAGINDEIKQIASGWDIGGPLIGHRRLRRIFFRWPSAKQGLWIIYSLLWDEVRVIRILHSARDLQRHLPS